MPFHSVGSSSLALSVYLVGEESHSSDTVGAVLAEGGRLVEAFSAGEPFFAAFRPGDWTCVVIGERLPDMSGVELLNRLRRAGHHAPAIIMGGCAGAPAVVAALEAGAVDYLERPYEREAVLVGIERAFKQTYRNAIVSAARAKASARLAELTPREWQVMDLVLDGHPNKNIAADLGISQRTVENHRASVMLKSGVKSLPALARLVMAVTGPDALFEPTELPHTPSWFSPAPQTAMGRF